MRVFKTKWFSRYARKEGIEDDKLAEAIREVEKGQIDAVLGGGLIKKRIPRDGSGKSGGYRSIIAYKSETRCLFLYCFAKSDTDNIDDEELREYKKFSQKFLGFSDDEIDHALEKSTIQEVYYNDKKI